MAARSPVIAILAIAALGLASLALLPGQGQPRADIASAAPVADGTAPSTPALDLIRRLNAEVSVSRPADAPVTEVAETAPPVAATALPVVASTQDLDASSSMPPPDAAGRPDRVGSSAVNLRSGPASSASQIGVLQPGDAVQVADMQNGWAQVTLADGRSGWVYSSYLLGGNPAAPADSQQVAGVTKAAAPRAVIQGSNLDDLVDRTAHVGSRLPAYAQPGDSEMVGQLQPGDEVRISEVRGNWLRVETDDGTTVWIRR